MATATLREERIRARLSVRQLARRAELSPATVRRLETGRRTPRLVTAYKLSWALGVAPTAIAEFRAASGPDPAAGRGDEEGDR
jgi:transcriptional regulator with XRE-family HTH domain